MTNPMWVDSDLRAFITRRSFWVAGEKRASILYFSPSTEYELLVQKQCLIIYSRWWCDTENKVKVELNYPISLAIISYQKRHEKLSISLKVLRNILLREELFSYKAQI